MRTIDADALSAFVGDLRSTLHKEQSTFKAMGEIEFNTRDYMLLNFQQTIDNAPTVSHGEWIPVSERLPEKNGVYIVTEKRFSMDKSLSDKYDIIVEPVEYSNGKWWRANFYKIIAWMPLPEPYKEEAENESDN